MRIARYKIWDGQENVITMGFDKPPSEGGKNVFTPEDWKFLYPFAAVPGKCIIHGGTINGQICEERDGFLQLRKEQGAPIELDGSMTDEEILEIVEIWEDAQGIEPQVPSAEERIAAALEAQVMMSMPDVPEEE